ncbi:MAG: alpha-isopropylmalate synthase regulatory domain-containing protein [Armatimonadota bacterium]
MVRKNKSSQMIEIMDTTLRDGEQTQGVSILPEEKLNLARVLLDRVKVDRIEIASARVSDGEKRAVTMVTDWAREHGYLDRVEMLGFCDLSKSADWVGEAGGKVINLLTKGSYKHLTEQLRKTPEQHVADIAATVEYCNTHGIECNCYPEDWSGGVLEKGDYADWFIRQIVQLPIRRIMLPDTLGRFSPDQVKEYIGKLVAEHPEVHFDFHGHNDYGLATANSLVAVQAGAKGLHVTVNGLGERAGNAPLDEVAVSLRDILGLECNVQEAELVNASKMVEVFSGRRIAPNKPISGSAVFTQTAGIHADGDKKGNLYITSLTPERFKRTRTYALGKHSGKASIEMNLKKLGLQLTPEQQQVVLARVIELGDQKKTLTVDDLPFIISDVINSPEEQPVKILDVVVTTSVKLLPSAGVRVSYNDKEYQAHATGNGGYDAFMKALRSITPHIGISLPKLLDYEVHIPPGGRTDALVETTITWEGGIVTRGVDSDQVRAAIDATEKMLNIVIRKK